LGLFFKTFFDTLGNNRVCVVFLTTTVVDFFFPCGNEEAGSKHSSPDGIVSVANALVQFSTLTNGNTVVDSSIGDGSNAGCPSPAMDVVMPSSTVGTSVEAD
jgi:hypothetical protein